MSVAYLPFARGARSVEAGWLADALDCRVDVVHRGVSLNVTGHAELPRLADLLVVLEKARTHACVVAEGIGGFLWAAVARAQGLRHPFTVLPYVNPTSWFDYTAIAAYRRCADPRDRVFVGSTPSARIYRALGVDTIVGEPFGIDCGVFHPRDHARATLARHGVEARAQLLLFAGRVEPDKDVRLLLAVALKARLLFPELRVVIAARVVDEAYLATARHLLAGESGLHLIVDPDRDTLADLYTAADAFVTASTSHFETFGRAPAEALACGTTAIAPRFDGFSEVLAQPGGRLVDIEFQTSGPRVGEAALLRAIYETLACTERPSRDRIAATARQRFCRSRTLDLLRHLPGAAPTMPATTFGAADLAIPDAWRVAEAGMQRMGTRELVEHLWDAREHRGAAAADGAFRIAIRNALARAAADVSAAPGTPTTCH